MKLIESMIVGRGMGRLLKTKSKFKKTHGMTGSPTYISWLGMMHRCKIGNGKHQKNYGARGIRVCKRWYKFENFLKDMGIRPDGKSIDRINNNSHYFKSNCRWSTTSEQNLNRRLPTSSKFSIIEFDGKSMCLEAWERHLNVKRGALRYRFNNGWSKELALTVPYTKKSFKVMTRKLQTPK